MAGEVKSMATRPMRHRSIAIASARRRLPASGSPTSAGATAKLAASITPLRCEGWLMASGEDLRARVGLLERGEVVEALERVLHHLPHRLHQHAGVIAVDEAVVERRGDDHRLPRHHLAVLHHRL